MSASSSFPPDVSAPLTADNPNNHSGLIVILASFYIVLVITALAARTYASFQRRIIQQDDLLFGVLVVVAILQAAVVLLQVHYGWGIRVEPGNAVDDRMLKAGYAAEIISILVLGLSKVSTCLFYEALFSQTQRYMARIILIAVIIWMIMSTLLLAVRCTPSPWADISEAQCSSLVRSHVGRPLQRLTSSLRFSYSCTQQWQCTKSRYRCARNSWSSSPSKAEYCKSEVCMYTKPPHRLTLFFGNRLIPLAGLRLHFIHSQIVSASPILIGAFATVTTEMYLATSVLCLVSAFLKSFIAAYEDSNGISYTDGMSGSNSKSRKGTLNTFTPKTRSRSRFSATVDRLRGWEREEDPIMGPTDASGGLQIYRTVQVDVSDEPIELTEAGRATV
ncbi:unnamed protein product [Penicillium salamii]|uniref:Rhodopsin domain-containing protein n=1 Tax=Penicillium salamii TaxID=1612424 RepID=A0A9W4NKU0_9EURO|nr:unnamed protein product [Penicillium salamii]CAG8269219.1 unnamed protein product [Penicillium salamii]CAG8309438.1 unnamed protein product [Penicillium salamii]CAG8355554.1 unnamed protein product [Penicillium salamii]CAG8358724.1 unnamed protein product [Penicillium salamii]